MNYLEIVKDYLSKSIEELMDEQQTCLYSLKASLSKLSENMQFDPSKAYFIYIMSVVGCDLVCDEKEYELLHKFINPSVTRDMVNNYLPELLFSEKTKSFIQELVFSVKAMSEIAYEEMIKIALAFLCANKDFSKTKEEYIKSIMIETVNA